MPIQKRQEMYVPGFTLMTGNLYSRAGIGNSPSMLREDMLGGGSGGGIDPFTLDRLLPEFIASGTASVSTTAGTIGFTYPASAIERDDFLLAVITVNDRGATANVNDDATDWTRIDEQLNGELALAAFYKRADGTETGAVTPFTWTSGDGINDVAGCQVYVYRYVDWDAGPLAGAATKTTGNLTSIDMPSVATAGKNGLAVCAMGFSDNITVTQNGVDPASETGGTWLAVGTDINSTSADDLYSTILQAPLAEAGTISGGSYSITATTPQSSKSAAIGFALVGMVDPADYETISVSIAASADDAREASDTTVNINSTTLFAVNAGSKIGLRFTGLSDLAGATIVQANIQLTKAANEGNTNSNADALIHGEDADASAQFAAVNANISGRTTTTASSIFGFSSALDATRNVRTRTNRNLKAILQEIVDRPGFTDVATFIFSQDGTNISAFAAQDHVTFQEATLTVRYIPA